MPPVSRHLRRIDKYKRRIRRLKERLDFFNSVKRRWAFIHTIPVSEVETDMIVANEVPRPPREDKIFFNAKRHPSRRHSILILASSCAP